MQILQDFKTGDHVWWDYYYAETICRGIIDWIENNLMRIRIPGEKDGCEENASARKINGQWLVHRSYQGYKEPLHIEKM
ncbi:MAG: hypothetical protein KAV41_03400 [Candidatus Pacebacteria bacterium]|nr:hypothetical protein [Candidatus Paceibacterota bacterium]